MKLVVALLGAACAFASVLPIPEGWKPWAARPEIAPRTFVDRQMLAICGNSNLAAYGGWEYTLPVEGGKWFRLSAQYRAEGLTYERMQVVARLDWKTADGKRVGQPDYAWQIRREGEWRHVTMDAPAPANARAVTVQLYLGNAPYATIWWRAISVTPIPAPGPREVTVAAVNFWPGRSSGPAETIRRLIEMIEQTVPPNTDIVVAGEGVPMAGTGKTYVDVAETIPGPTTEALGELARKRRMWIVAGIYEREATTIYNTAVLINREGRVAGKYRKVYLPREEIEGGLTPGNSYPVFQTDFGTIGLMICWDVQYPDPARALALAGAELILMPIAGGSQTLGKARAIENHVFLASSGYQYPTEILDPNGETLARAEKRAAAVTTIDLNRRYPDSWLGEMRNRMMKEVRFDVPVDPGYPR
ncbi:MAG: carbon-nitrogen hydrolase family protein [Rhodospirillales bacterium]